MAYLENCTRIPTSLWLALNNNLDLIRCPCNLRVCLEYVDGLTQSLVEMNCRNRNLNLN